MISVYHVDATDSERHARLEIGFKPTEESILKAIEEGKIKYERVAHLRTFSLNEAWEKTNTIERNWWTNNGVTLVGKAKEQGGARSSMVGDVFVVHGGTDRAYFVAPFGFERLNNWKSPQ